MPRTSERPKNLKEAFVEAATLIVDQKGSTALSLRDLARECHVSPAALYRHFKDRRSLLAEIAARSLDELRERIDAALDDDGGPFRDRLVTASQTYVRFARQYPERYRLMFGPELEKSTYERFQKASDDARRTLFVAVQLGRRARAIKAGDATDQAMTFWALLHGFSLLVIDDRLREMGFQPAEAEAKMKRSFESLLVGLGSAEA